MERLTGMVLHSDLALTIDGQMTSPARLVTRYREISLDFLRQYALDKSQPLRGKPLQGRFRMIVDIRRSYYRQGFSRVTFSPEYEVYISRLGDRRQWVQWPSNGKLEAYFLAELRYLIKQEAR